MYQHSQMLTLLCTIQVWFDCVGEMVALCEEATRRRTEALQLSEAPPPLSFHYIADRLDVDDPLHGYQVQDTMMAILLEVELRVPVT